MLNPGLLSLVAALAWSAPAPKAPFDASLQIARDAARAHFLTHAPGAKTTDLEVRLPDPGDDPQARLQFEEFKQLLGAARAVEEGCEPACQKEADIALYVTKVQLVATQLGGDAQAAVGQYVKNGVPRMKPTALAGKPQTDAERALEAQAVAALLQNPAVPDGTRAALQAKALRIAEALGRTKEITADADGLVTVAPGVRGRLSAEELRQLNEVPRVQATYLRRLAAAPPPLSPEEKQRRAVAEAERVVEENGGTVADAYKFWDEKTKDPNAWKITKAYAWLNKGLLTFSGLRDVEASAGRLGYVWDNQDVGGWQKTKMGAALAGNFAMSAATFIPPLWTLAGTAKNGLYTVSKGGTVIRGLTKAEPAVAGAMTEVTSGVRSIITKVLPNGKKITKVEMPQMVDELNAFGSRFGVSVKTGGTIGQSTSNGGQILVNLRAGGPHEMSHVLQQFQTRVLLVEKEAARLGKTVDKLTDAERASAFKQASLFEEVAYAQHESQAFRTSYFSGAARKDYTRAVLQNADEIDQALKTGTVINSNFTVSQKLYGATAHVFGHSTPQIGANVLPIFLGVVQTQKDAWRDIGASMAPSLFNTGAFPPEPTAK